MKTKQTADLALGMCYFDSNQYSYSWSTNPRKGWGQRRCPRCGLWTVHIHHALSLTASQCDGVETFWAQTRAILALHEQRGTQIRTPTGRRTFREATA